MRNLASLPGPAQLFLVCSTASDRKLGGDWERGWVETGNEARWRLGTRLGGDWNEAGWRLGTRLAEIRFQASGSNCIRMVLVTRLRQWHKIRKVFNEDLRCLEAQQD